tara:strand:+ start:1739 stop:1891 length:153 start_codon:yes stop_codon:yes gene_type:complete
MNIKDMTLEQLTKELNRARFWVEQNPIKKSLKLINKMDKRKSKLINDKLK